MKNIEYNKGIKADEQIGDYEDSLTAKYPNMFDDLPDEYDPKVFLNHIKSKIEPKEWKKLSGLYSKANQYSNKQYATYVNQLEDAIESNPVKAAEVLPEGSEIQKEAVEAAIGKGPEKEVDNKVVGDFLNTYKNPDVHLSETMEKENEEWRNKQQLNDSTNIVTNGTPASELSPHDLDMLDPTDKTEIAGDIDDMAAEDNAVLSDLNNQDENAEVEVETEKPVITDSELQSSATEAPETIDTFDGLTDNNAAELADTMSAIEELYKIHNSLPKPSGKVGSDAMLKEIAKHTKDNEEYKPGRYNDFLFNFKETPIPSSAAPNIDAPEVTGNISGPQNVIQNEPTITSTSNGLPSSISTGTGNVSNGNVSTTSNNNDTSIITNGTPTSGSAPISKDANAPEG